MSTVRIQVRRGTATDWSTVNPTLAAGEIGYETNTGKLKIGDGSTAWTSLDYISSDVPAVGEIAQDAINAALAMGDGLSKTYDDAGNTITLENTGVLAFNTRTGEVTLTDSDVNTALGYTAADAADLSSYITSNNAALQNFGNQTSDDITQAIATAEAYTDGQIALEVASRNTAITDSISASETAMTNYTNETVNSSFSNFLDSSPEFSGTVYANGFTATGDISGHNFTISGNLNVAGTTTTTNSNTLNVEDPIIYIGSDNTGNTVDLGIVGSNTIGGVYSHTGLVKDATDGYWKFFKGVTDEPSNTVNISQGSLDDLSVNILSANSAVIGDVTNTKIQYLKNLNADLQDSLDLKAPLESPIFTGYVTLPENTVIGEISSSEISSLNAIEGNIQTQLNSKLSIATAASTYATANNPVFSGTIILPDQSITSDMIENETILTIDISDAAITSDKIANSSVTTDKIANNAVFGDKIPNKAITSAKIADAAVGPDQISSVNQNQVTDLTLDLSYKAPLDTPTFTGTVVLPSTTSIGTVSGTEISYVNGVTSAIQTQLDSKAADSTVSSHISSTTSVHGIADTAALATKTYADNVANTAKNDAKDYADSLASNYDAAGSASTAQGAAAVYTDNAISTEVTNRNSAIATAKSQAISTAEAYADTKKAEAITAAEGYTDTAVANLVNSAPGTLDTLKELADALGADANFSTTVASNIATAKADAESYTDSKIATEVTSRNSAIDTAKSDAISTSEGYTDTHAALTEAHGATGAVVGTTNTQTLTNKTLTSPVINTPTGITKSDVGLSNVNNTSDANKPISTATQSALDLKAPIDSPTFTGTVTLPTGTVTSGMILDGTIVNGDISSSAAIALSKLATDPLARANHTGTQTASTISDFDSQVNTHKVTDLTAPTSAFSMNSQKITSLGTPTEDYDAATKAYVDAAVNNINVHEAVVAATTGNVNLNTQVRNGDTLDGILLSTNNRILVKNQNTPSQNGIYIVTGGAATRATDYDAAGEVSAGDFVFVKGGSVNGNTGWIQTADVTTVGTDSLTFTQFSGAGTYTAGTGLTLTGTTFSINTATTADLSTAQTLTNKTISGSSNTLSNIGNSSLTNSAVTVGTTNISLGGSSTTLAGLTSVTSTAFTGALTGNVTGNVSGNAGTVTNGVYTTDTGTVTSTMIADGTIVNADINASAAIAATKISGTAVTQADTGTVTNTMLAGSIANAKLSNSSVTIGSTSVSLGSTAATIAGLTLTSPTIATITNTGTLTLPTSTDTLVGRATTDTLTNKTFDTAGTGNVFKINGTGISAITGTGSVVLATSPSVTGLSTDTLTTTGNVTVGGNLTVNGTTTTVNSTTLAVADSNIEIAKVATPTDVTANGAGITVKGTTDKTLNWVSSTAAFTSSENLDLASGKTYKINGTTVLSSTAVGGQTIPASAIVGLTDTQTLTNKTLTSPSITTPTVSSGTLTVSSSGITFSDGTVQTVAATPSLTPINSQTASLTTSSSIVKDSFVQMNVATANTITIAPDSTYNYPVGASIDFQQLGAGQTSFVAGAGVTLQAASINGTQALKFRGQYSVATALKVAANTWALFGDLSI